MCKSVHIVRSALMFLLFVLAGCSGNHNELKLPVHRIACMSSSYIAYLEAIGADSLVCAVSGISYISNSAVLERYKKTVSGNLDGELPLYDIGYDTVLDYDKIYELKPDVVVAYTIGGSKPDYMKKLESLGLNVYVMNDYLAESPLERASAVLEFGRLTGREELARHYYDSLSARYNSLAASVVRDNPVKVLINIPYSDVWYIPGADSYMSQLIRDAGGEILGTEAGTKSGTISMENAYALSMEADVWLNPGMVSTRRELASLHQIFPRFAPLSRGLPIYNNTLRMTGQGGNDFWESGAAHPDRILEDLIKIFSAVRDGEEDNNEYNYHFRLD